MRILGVDLGTKGGLATEDWHSSWDDSPIANRPASRDKRLLRYWERLEDLKDQVDLVAFEAARCSKHISALIVIAEYQGLTKLWCRLHNKPYVSYSPSEIKKFATGHGRADKEDMLKAAKRFRGEGVQNFDAADAICIYELAKSDLIFIEELGHRANYPRKPKKPLNPNAE